MKKISVWYRVAILISSMWVLHFMADSFWSGLIMEGQRGFSGDRFIRLGIMPVVLIWGIWWIISGIRKRKVNHE